MATGGSNNNDFFVEQGKLLEDFLYKLAKFEYKPHGYEHGSTYQPQSVVKKLQDEIAVFG